MLAGSLRLSEDQDTSAVFGCVRIFARTAIYPASCLSCQGCGGADKVSQLRVFF